MWAVLSVTAAAAILGAVLLVRSGWMTAPRPPSQPAEEEAYPVAEASDVTIISMDARDVAALVVGEPPVAGELIFAQPADVRVIKCDAAPTVATSRTWHREKCRCSSSLERTIRTTSETRDHREGRVMSPGAVRHLCAGFVVLTLLAAAPPGRAEERRSRFPSSPFSPPSATTRSTPSSPASLVRCARRTRN